MQKLVKVTDRLYYLPSVQETDRPILGAIIGEEKTLLIDAGNSSQHTNLFLQQLKEIGVEPDLLALTHWHWDHVFGLSEVDMPSIAFQESYENMKEMQSLSWEDEDLDQRVREGTEIEFCADAIKLEFGNERNIEVKLPTMTFKERMTIHLGDLTCEIEHVGGDHSSDSCVIFVPEEKALFVGDCLYANMYAEKWNYTVEKTLKLVQKLETYDADIFFLSHHPGPLTKEAFNSLVYLLKSVAELTQKHAGNEEAIRQELSVHLQRNLNEDELETITFFVNGH
ncbi:MBL fold metallo-hydrolase [Sporosarcina sp. ACRSL]|uniref:MBL fold metallo-hydrolase n=1 Tax=Sporosarcina sp. ACRSL TaxID=2918215 RepID=UPI001EF46640|nr:MBL fold metallo-hydrolase [Sporosarcina sp. ACRSL]MCG7345699.1 MBL fold metallo-hydrolase [Sporosarcina sp. ACRSL]